jgi:phage terminase small subunit
MAGTQRLNLRQQAFLKHYLKCGNASEASRRAGYKSRPDVQGSRLLGNVGIRKVLKMKWNQDRLTAEAEEFLRMAKEDRRIGEGKGVLELIAKVAGLLTEAKHNPENRPRDKDDAELRAAVERELAELRRVSGKGASADFPDRVH